MAWGWPECTQSIPRSRCMGFGVKIHNRRIASQTERRAQYQMENMIKYRNVYLSFEFIAIINNIIWIIRSRGNDLGLQFSRTISRLDYVTDFLVHDRRSALAKFRLNQAMKWCVDSMRIELKSKYVVMILAPTTASNSSRNNDQRKAKERNICV